MRNSLRSVGDSLSSTEAWYSTQIFSGTSFSPEDEAALLETVTREEVVEAARSFSPDTVFLLEGECRE